MRLSRLFCFPCVCVLFFATATFSQQVAITVDDLPSHGALPPGMTRADVAKSILKALQDNHAPKVYGFINARKLDGNPEDMEVLKLWRDAGYPLGNHTFSHLSLNASTAGEFDQNVADDEPVLKSLMRRHHVAQVTLDFEDYLWNGPYARCVEKNDAASIEWLKSSYMSNATEYIALGQSMAKLVFGRDIKHVLVLHIGSFETVMLPQLLDSLRQRGFKFITLPDAEKDPAYKSDPDVALKEGGTLLDQMMEGRHLDFPPHNDKPYDQLNALCR